MKIFVDIKYLKLEAREKKILLSYVELDPLLRRKLQNDSNKLEVSDDELIYLWEFCGDFLGLEFDSEGVPNTKALILENLIDKVYDLLEDEE